MSPRILRALFVLLAGLCLMACQTAPQIESQRDPNREFDKATGELVMSAQTLAQSGEYDEALKKLELARSMADLNAYEASTIEMIMGAYEYERDDIPASIEHYKRALTAGGLLPGEVKSTESNIGQLLLANGQFCEGTALMMKWLDDHGDDKRVLNYAMQGHILSGNYDAALPLAERWFSLPHNKVERPENLMDWLKTEFNESHFVDKEPVQIVCY